MELTDFVLDGSNILPIVKYPSSVLAQPTSPVTEFNDDLRQLVHSMLNAMYYEPGCGLAANQVGVSKRIFVTDTDYVRKEVGNEFVFQNLKPRVFINPRIKSASGEQICEEGCLSFPGISVQVKRHMDITIEFEGLDGKTRELSTTDFFSNCIQHENDHLEGITFFDRLSPLKKRMAQKSYLKRLKRRGDA